MPKVSQLVSGRAEIHMREALLLSPCLKSSSGQETYQMSSRRASLQPNRGANFQCAFTSLGLGFCLCKIVLLGHTACVFPGLPPPLLTFPLGTLNLIPVLGVGRDPRGEQSAGRLAAGRRGLASAVLAPETSSPESP